MSQKNLAILTGGHIYINKGFLQKNVWPFCQAAIKKSGRNNKVTMLLRWPLAGFHCIYDFFFRFIPCSHYLHDMNYVVQLVATGIPEKTEDL